METIASVSLRAIFLSILLSLFAARQTPDTALNRPVTALFVAGDHLLIGQGAALVEAQITPTALTVIRTSDLQHGAIRAITAINGAILILSEDGLSTWDASGGVSSFTAGGGQRIATRGDRVYVAALNAGVTIYKFDASGAGKLKLLGHVDTSAEDIAPDGTNWLWVASGAHGLRLYDLTDPANPVVLSDNSSYVPARLVRVSGTRLYLGYANKLAVFDTVNVKAPRVLSETELGINTASVGDVLIEQNQVIAGRVDITGSDVLLMDASNPAVLREVAHVGDAGSGDRLALHGGDLFVGSERLGLQRVRVEVTALTHLQSWDVSEAPPCTDFTPRDPQPANLSQIAPDTQVTLSWRVACPAAHYAIEINGVRAAVTDQASYPFTLQNAQTVWRVIPLDAQNQPISQVTSAAWSFEMQREGYLITPQPPKLDALLYKPPLIQIDTQSPTVIVAGTCIAVAIGFVIIVIGAAAIGAWFDRRRARNY